MKNLAKDIEDLHLRPLYFFNSKSAAVLDEKVQAVKKKMRGIIDIGMDLKVFDAAETEKEAFLDFIGTPSFFSSRKVAVIRNAHKLAKDLAGAIAAQACASPDASTVFVLLSEKSKLPAVLSEAVRQVGASETLKKPLTSDVKKWLAEKMKIDGLRMTPEALALLLENTGEDLALLASEYEKVLTFSLSEAKKPVEKRDVSLLVHRDLQTLIFDLVDFIGKRDKEHALLCLKKVFRDQESLIGAVTLLYRMFKAMFYINAGNADTALQYLSRGAGMRPEIAAMLLRKYKSYSAHYSRAQIIQVFGTLHAFNQALRSSSGSDMLHAVRTITEIIEME